MNFYHEHEQYYSGEDYLDAHLEYMRPEYYEEEEEEQE